MSSSSSNILICNPKYMRISFVPFIVLSFTTIFLASCVGIQNNPQPIPSTQSGKVIAEWAKQEVLPIFSLSEKEFDFGTIKQSGGKVEHSFIIQYNWKTPLKITWVPTSCACTTAKIDKTTLNPGDSATVTVTFDPNLHAEPEGKFFKTISILTNPTTKDAPELKIWAIINLDLGKDAYKLKAPHDD